MGKNDAQMVVQIRKDVFDEAIKRLSDHRMPRVDYIKNDQLEMAHEVITQLFDRMDLVSEMLIKGLKEF